VEPAAEADDPARHRFGQTGPVSQLRRVSRASSRRTPGLTYITGEPDGTPTHPSYPIGDPISGVFGAFGVLVALFHRMKHPDGTRSGNRSFVHRGRPAPARSVADRVRTARARAREDRQLELVSSPPAGVFRSGDGEWVTFTAPTQSVFERFCALIERKDLLADARFSDNPSRMNHLDELNEIVARWIGERPLAEVVAQLSEAGVSVAPIYSNRQILDDPHFRARGSIARAKDEDFGSVAVPGVVPRLSATPGEVRTSGPAPGAHNAEVYGDWLGLSQDEQQQLRTAGVI
jgi:crotonobetainyl-CoA:carnitine CoA-transferase CaiB-like acyl-CoA transferase